MSLLQQQFSLNSAGRPFLSTASFMVALGVALLAFARPTAAAATADPELHLIEVLQSGASLAEKDAACEKLKQAGTARCVPALATLLADAQLSHSARYVLESLPLTEAARALREALAKTEGETRLGIINSVGMRGDTRAVPALAKLLNNSDTATAIAAAQALGHIGTPEALKPLEGATHSPSREIADAAVDGVLRCATRTLTMGNPGKALRIFEGAYQNARTDTVRLAAYRGMIRASGPGGVRLIARALEGEPSPARQAALQMVREVQAPGATVTLAELLRRVNPMVQLALLEGLRQRGDPAAAPAIAALAAEPDPQMKLAVIKALGALGNASNVPLLSEIAAGGSPSEQQAARQALVDLHRGKVADTLLDQLPTANPEVKAELARALGDRGETAAFPRLVELAQRGPAPVRHSAVKAMGSLADNPQLADLIRCVADAPDAQARQDAAEALNAACQRITAKRGQIEAAALVRAAAQGPKPTRVALLPICSGLVSPQVRVAIRTGVEDPDPEIRAAAIRALCDTIDGELLEDIIALARITKDENFRALAISGGVRLVTDEEIVKISRGRRITALQALLASSKTPEQKRLALAGLGEMPDADALKVVAPCLDEAGIQTEAARAAIKIGVALPSNQSQDTLAVLNKGLSVAPDEATQKALQGAIQQIQATADFITDWLAAGPYRQAGKNYAALFDIVFAPETDDQKGVDWKTLPAGADPKRPYVMDLFKGLGGGQQCVAYARTWLHTDNPQSVLLELGSDDGVKVWVNDKQVYAHNVARALQPGSDKVTVPLHAGWNMLLLKITQNTLGWEFCARVLKPDGTHLDGIQIEAAPKSASASTP